MKIVYGIFTPKDFGNNGDFLPSVTPLGKSTHYRGFHYFSPNHVFSVFENHDRLFFLAFKNEIKAENIIGVLKSGIYNLDSTKPYRSINYVDIHKKFRRKGIATHLLEMLNEFVKNEDGINSIYCSRITNSGEKKGMRRLVNEKITYNLFLREY